MGKAGVEQKSHPTFTLKKHPILVGEPEIQKLEKSGRKVAEF